MAKHSHQYANMCGECVFGDGRKQGLNDALALLRAKAEEWAAIPNIYDYSATSIAEGFRELASLIEQGDADHG